MFKTMKSTRAFATICVACLIYAVCHCETAYCAADDDTFDITAAPQYTREDKVRVMAILDDVREKKAAGELSEGIGDVVVYIARKFIGIPYVGHTLEINDRERLVVNLRQLDCTTYVENVVALTLCVTQEKYTFETFCHNLCHIRYMKDSTPQYVTRLHYFTTWIEQNTLKGICQEVSEPSPPFTGEQKVAVNYMTTHVDKYKMLAAHPEDTAAIRQQEAAITGRIYAYIPQEQLADSRVLRSTIHDGDLIAIITTKAGLDTQHVGIAVWHSDGLHLLNASSIHHKVVEEKMTLQQYLMRHPSMPGIRVVRLRGA